MNQLFRNKRPRSFTSPHRTKYVIMFGIGLWLIGTSVFLLSFQS